MIDRGSTDGIYGHKNRLFALGTFAAMDGGATLVLVSNSPDLARELCDRAVWLDNGQAVAQGPVDEVVDAFVGGHGSAASTERPARGA